MALYIFQFGLLQPLASVAGSQLVVVRFTLVLLIVMVANNRFGTQNSRLPRIHFDNGLCLMMCTLANSK